MIGKVRVRRMRTLCIASAAALVAGSFAVAAAPANAESREYLDTRIFAEVPSPGHPEGIVVSDDGVVYVATDQNVLELPNPPSKLFAYDQDGTLINEYEIEGQGKSSGLLGMEMDANGIIYIVDRHPQRIIALDPETGEQWDYATFEQVRDLCVPGPVTSLASQCLYPDDLTFGPDGSMYVTDVAQALLWRVPPGGGKAEVWFEDEQIFSLLGPNGIEFKDDGKTLMFSVTLKGAFDALDSLRDGDVQHLASGKIFSLTVNPDGSPGKLETFWEAGVGEGIDGIGIAESGNVYATIGLGGNGVAAISADGKEIGRTPANILENQLSEVPFDTPGNVKFDGERMLVTNHAPFVAKPGAFVVYDIHAGEPGMRPVRPDIPR